MKTILYVIGTGSPTNNAELRYSLRMLEKNGLGAFRVIISGDIPSFVSDATETVLCHDLDHTRKHWNMAHKIMRAIETFKLTGDILFSSDDHFLFRKADMENWPRYHRGPIYTEDEWRVANGRDPGKYQKSMAATRKLLLDNGYGIMNNICHMNMHINVDAYKEALELMYRHVDDSLYGFESIAVAANIEARKNPAIIGEYKRIIKDVKCSRFERVKQTLSRNDVNMFSISDKVYADQNKMMKWFENNYPEKSKWER